MDPITLPPALRAIHQSVQQARAARTVREAMAQQALQPVFQPIGRLRDGVVVAHEALIRGPANSPLAFPDALFAAARREGLVVELEQHCVERALQVWGALGLGTRLFVNLSAMAVVELGDRWGSRGLMAALRSRAVPPSAVVVEVTEHDQVPDLSRLLEAVAVLRAQGVQFALDDFGNGHSNLRLWAELRPELIKIDKYFISQAPTDAVKVQTLKGLMRFAETFGTTVVAEGIETAEEMRVVRDLGIELGQGYFLGRPANDPAPELLEPARSVARCPQVAVLPEPQRNASGDLRAERLMQPVPPVRHDSTVDDVARLFERDETLRAVAVVDQDRAVGLIHRQGFLNQYSKMYFKELYSRKPCLLFANTSPLLLDKHTGLDGLTEVLTSTDQRYLTEGFIVTEGGRYLGLGTGEQLVRVVTEVRMEAARHANPLTFLPGNIPISEHIARLLATGIDFVACYADLNDFKPFNDHYGYWRGDEMIRLLARSIVARADARRDFVGHVGGDDFVVLFQSQDWLDRCEEIIASFNEEARTLFDAAALARGGIEAEDRHGVQRFFPFTSLSIGALRVQGGAFSRPEEVASAAAAAKHQAKVSAVGLYVQAGTD